MKPDEAVTPEPEVKPEAIPEVKEDKKPEDKKEVKLDSSKSMTSQVDKLLKDLPEDKKEEKPEEEVEPPVPDPEVKEPTLPPDDNEIIEPVDLPPISKYILDNLPTIQVMGHTEGAKDKVYTVKRGIYDLPLDFEFASRRDELVFNAAVAAQEMNARELKTKYETNEASNKAQEYLNQQAQDVQSDITDLQKEKILPEFKYDSDDPKFNDDPAVKEANTIYALFERTNKAHMDAGRAYRISYRDAADKFYAARGRAEPENPKVDNSRKEREEVAAKVGAPQGASAEKGKPRMPSGSNFSDVLKLYKQGRI